MLFFGLVSMLFWGKKGKIVKQYIIILKQYVQNFIFREIKGEFL